MDLAGGLRQAKRSQAPRFKFFQAFSRVRKFAVTGTALLHHRENVANWGPLDPLKFRFLFALFFTSLPRVPIPSVIASQSPPARWRCHFRHEGAKAETPIPLWTNQILGFPKFRFSGFRVGRDFKGAGSPLRGKLIFFAA